MLEFTLLLGHQPRRVRLDPLERKRARPQGRGRAQDDQPRPARASASSTRSFPNRSAAPTATIARPPRASSRILIHAHSASSRISLDDAAPASPLRQVPQDRRSTSKAYPPAERPGRPLAVGSSLSGSTCHVARAASPIIGHAARWDQGTRPGIVAGPSIFAKTASGTVTPWPARRTARDIRG